MKRPVLSFVVPAYNSSSTLARALFSVLGQGDGNVEIVVVNDGSTDETSDIAHRVASAYSNVKVIDAPNGGVAKARNLGIGHASGSWVIFLDSDDELEPDTLKQIIELAAHSEYDIIFGMKEYVNSDAGTSYLHLELSNKGEHLRRISVDTTLRSLLSLGESSLSGSCTRALYKRDWLEAHSLRFPVGITMGEDYCFLLACLASEPEIGAAGLLFYKVNQSGASTTRRHIPNMHQSMAYNNEIIETVVDGSADYRVLAELNFVNNSWIYIDNEAKQSLFFAAEACRDVYRNERLRNSIRKATAPDITNRRRFTILKIGLVWSAVPAFVIRAKRRRDGFK